MFGLAAVLTTMPEPGSKRVRVSSCANHLAAVLTTVPEPGSNRVSLVKNQGPLGKKSLHWPFRVLEPSSRKNLVPLVLSLCVFVQSSWK